MIEENEFYRIMAIIQRLAEKGKERNAAYQMLVDRAFEIAPKDVSDDFIRIAVELGYVEPEQALDHSFS